MNTQSDSPVAELLAEELRSQCPGLISGWKEPRASTDDLNGGKQATGTELRSLGVPSSGHLDEGPALRVARCPRHDKRGTD